MRRLLSVNYIIYILIDVVVIIRTYRSNYSLAIIICLSKLVNFREFGSEYFIQFRVIYCYHSTNAILGYLEKFKVNVGK